MIEKRQSQKIGCIEEVAYQRNFITTSKLKELSGKYGKSEYGAYVSQLGKNL